MPVQTFQVLGGMGEGEGAAWQADTESQQQLGHMRFLTAGHVHCTISKKCTSLVMLQPAFVAALR